MPEFYPSREQAIRERAYFQWQNEGCPEGRALEHWQRAIVEDRAMREDNEGDEEKVLEGRTDADIPALLTKDVKGG